MAAHGLTNSGATRRHVLWASAAAAVPLAVLYRFPPAAASFYPACPIHQFTGLLCPGCGSTRALYLLLHGHFSEAVHLNALFVLIVLPALLLYLAVSFNRAAWMRISSPAIVAATVLALGFTIVRNLS